MSPASIPGVTHLPALNGPACAVLVSCRKVNSPDPGLRRNMVLAEGCDGLGCTMPDTGVTDLSGQRRYQAGVEQLARAQQGHGEQALDLVHALRPATVRDAVCFADSGGRRNAACRRDLAASWQRNIGGFRFAPCVSALIPARPEAAPRQHRR